VKMAGQSPACSPYEAVLEDAFAALAPEVRRAHLAPLVAAGLLNVEHGSHWLAPLLVRLLKLPAAGREQPARLEVSPCGDELLWTRQIGIVVLRTRQRAARSRLVERMGPGTIAFRLAASNGALLYQQVSFSVVGIPVPAFIAPHVSARISRSVVDRWHVEVTVLWRRHLVCRYSGQMSFE